MKPAIDIVRIPKGQYDLILNQKRVTWGELQYMLEHVCRIGLILEQSWGNGLGPIAIGTANFITE